MAANIDKYQKITYYKLPENYHYFEDVDVTKFESLTGDEIDSNFFVLEGRDIDSIDVSEDRKRLIITLINGSTIESDNIFNDYIETLGFDYDKETGVLTVCINDCDHEPIKVEGFLTLQDVAKMLNEFYVYTDDTITGDGTLNSPLSVANSQRTGMVKAVDDVVDELPLEPIIGSRYITYDTIDNNGRFYNFDGIFDVLNALEEEGNGWTVASKYDWGGILNYLEKEVYRDHNKPFPSKWLGNQAGLKLKESPIFGLEYCGYVFDDDEKSVSFKGEKASFWCNTNTMGKPLTENDTQAWVKQFQVNGPRKGQVYQTIIDNAIYSSIRLVKEIEDGETVSAAEILGTVYPVSVIKTADGKSKMWITTNLDYDTENNNSFKGESTLDTKPFINEWDGDKWIKYGISDYTAFILKSKDEIYYVKDGVVVPMDNNSQIEDLTERVSNLELKVEELTTKVSSYHKDVQTKLEEARAYVYDPEYVYKGEFEFGEDSINYTIDSANIGEGGKNIMNDFARLLGGLYRTNKVEPIRFEYKYYDWDDEGDNKGSNYKLVNEPIRQDNSLVTAIVAAYLADPTATFKVKFDHTVVNVKINII